MYKRQVFTERLASKAIILGPSKRADADAVARGKRMVEQLKGVLRRFWTAAEGVDTGGAVEGHLNQVTGMIKLRQEEFGVDIGDFIKLTGAKGQQKTMLKRMGIPFARATIAKGRALTTHEAQNVMQGKAWDSL